MKNIYRQTLQTLFVSSKHATYLGHYRSSSSIKYVTIKIQNKMQIYRIWEISQIAQNMWVVCSVLTNSISTNFILNFKYHVFNACGRSATTETCRFCWRDLYNLLCLMVYHYEFLKGTLPLRFFHNIHSFKITSQ